MKLNHLLRCALTASKRILSPIIAIAIFTFAILPSMATAQDMPNVPVPYGTSGSYYPSEPATITVYLPYRAVIDDINAYHLTNGEVIGTAPDPNMPLDYPAIIFTVMPGPSDEPITMQTKPGFIKYTFDSIDYVQTSSADERIHLPNGEIIVFNGQSGVASISQGDMISPAIAPETGYTYSGTTPFNISVTFPTNVTGLDASDFKITGGTVSSVSRSGSSAYYIATLTPDGSGGPISVKLEAAKVLGANSSGYFYMPNRASNTLIFTPEDEEGTTPTDPETPTEPEQPKPVDPIIAQTQRMIAGFMANRTNLLATRQPDIARFLDRQGCGNLDVNAQESHGTLQGCFANGNTWAEASATWTDDGSYSLISAGGHYFIGENALLGFMAQFDTLSADDGMVEGNGWMIGPYFTAKAANDQFFFEGRLLYGQSSNDISPAAGMNDSFDTNRWLTQFKVYSETGYISAAGRSMTVWRPYADVTFAGESQNAYTDSRGNRIGQTEVNLFQADIGVDFERPIRVERGDLKLIGGISAVYTENDYSNYSFDGTRGVVELGIDYSLSEQLNIQLNGTYDGIGSDYEALGITATVAYRF